MDMTTTQLNGSNIHQRMLAVMKDISYVQKSEKQVNNQYRFVTHDSVTALVRGALLVHGIVATTSVTKHQQDGNRTEVDVRVEFINVDRPEDRVTVDAFGYGIDPQDKGPGKAVSYAVKYAYLKAFALETGDDPERDNIDHKPKVEPELRPQSPSQFSKEAFESMEVDMQIFISDHARELTAMHGDGKSLLTYVNDLALDTDEKKMALWSKLPSNVRAAIKKEQGKPTPQQLATQP